MSLDSKYFRQKKKITMRYEQASAEETIHFMNQNSNEKVIERVIKFVKKHSDYKNSYYRYIIGNFDGIFDTIIKTYHKWVFDKQEKKPSKKWRKSIFSANLVYLSEKLNIHPKKLLQEYTMEQMNYLSEWLIFNANEWSKEGQRENDKLSRWQTWMSKEDIIKSLDRIPD